MADDAHSHFVDGLRVTAEHLEHLQDSLHDAVLDLRRTAGVGRIAFGLRVSAGGGGSVQVEPGVAFAPSGVRLAVEAPLAIAIQTLPARLLLRASNEDKPSLRVAGTPTLIFSITTAVLEATPAPPPDPDALVIATLREDGGNPVVEQDPALFISARGTGMGEKGERGEKGEKGDPGEKGDKGDAGAKGDKGDPGVKGDKGDAGERGEKGEKGDAGAKGDKGDAGAKGDKGDPGEKGDKGDAGAKGDKGEAGAKGDKGDAGAKGDKGDAGAKGDKGDVGAKGDKGDAGAKGDKGDAGAKGDKGDAGAKGDKGDAGAKGDKGDRGEAGQRGAPGVQGIQGPPGVQGPPGPPAQVDSPFILRVNWPHGTRMAVQALVAQLNGGLQFIVSSPLHPTLLDRQPQVVEVYFEPDSPVQLTAAISAPQPMLFVHGTVRLQPEVVTWICTDTSSALEQLFRRTGGRVQIRLHAGHLFDVSMRPFSSAVDALTGTAAVHVPGGTFEGWLFSATT